MHTHTNTHTLSLSLSLSLYLSIYLYIYLSLSHISNWIGREKNDGSCDKVLKSIFDWLNKEPREILLTFWNLLASFTRTYGRKWQVFTEWNFEKHNESKTKSGRIIILTSERKSFSIRKKIDKDLKKEKKTTKWKCIKKLKDLWK